MSPGVVNMIRIIFTLLVLSFVLDIGYCSSIVNDIRSKDNPPTNLKKRELQSKTATKKPIPSTKEMSKSQLTQTQSTTTTTTTADSNQGTAKLKGHINCSLPSNVNETECKKDDHLLNSVFTIMSDNSDMLFRTMYVLLGLTSIVVLYFVVRAVRLRRCGRKSKSRKYGIITNRRDRGDMEMEPLGDGEDEDDDYTLYEMNGRKK